MVGAPSRVSARVGVRVTSTLAAAFVVAVALVATGVALVFLVSGALRDTLGAAELRSVLDTLLFHVLLAVPVLIIVVGLTTYLFIGRSLRPVEALRKQAVTAVEQGGGQPLPQAAAEDEVARLAETMNALLERLDGAAAVERRLAAAGHELRGPLVGLAGELGQIQRGSSVDRAAIGALRGEVERLGRVVEAVLGGVPVPGGGSGPLPHRAEPGPPAGNDQLTVPVATGSPPGGLPAVPPPGPPGGLTHGRSGASAVDAVDPGERTTVITPLVRGPQDDRPVRDGDAKEDPITAPRGIPAVRPGEGGDPAHRHPLPHQGPPHTNPHTDPRGMPADPRGSTARPRIR